MSSAMIGWISSTKPITRSEGEEAAYRGRPERHQGRCGRGYRGRRRHHLCAVSYTHLDVYKRQTCNCSANCSCVSPLPRRTAASRSPNAICALLCFRCRQSVSYTHLDVYKRQEERRNDRREGWDPHPQIKRSPPVGGDLFISFRRRTRWPRTRTPE